MLINVWVAYAQFIHFWYGSMHSVVQFLTVCCVVVLVKYRSVQYLVSHHQPCSVSATPDGRVSRSVRQAAVRAATLGRVLVLEGIEKAERNVLPVLNNLMENREMQLEDGRFLLNPTKYDSLLQVCVVGSLYETIGGCDPSNHNLQLTLNSF